MRTKFIAILFLSLFVYSRSAYAIIDIMAWVQSGLELKTEVQNKIHEIRKQIDDAQKRIKQGFSIASNCFKNPLKCDLKGFKNLATGTMFKIPVMPGAEQMKTADLTDVINSTGAAGLIKEVRENYIYRRNKADSLKELSENRKNIHSVIRDEIALQFAKGMATRHNIQNEADKDVYTHDFKQNNIEEILSAQNISCIMSANRLARIVELRAHMVGAEASASLTEQSLEAEENTDE